MDRYPRRRPERKPRRMTPSRSLARLRWILALVPIVLAAGTTYAVLRTPLLTVQSVNIEGASNLRGEKLAIVSGLQGATLLSPPFEEARARLLQIPQVRAVSFRRDLPRGLTIRVEERLPAAFWSVGEIDYLVDAEGIVLGVGRADGGVPLIVETGVDRSLSPGERVHPDAIALAVRITREAPRVLNQGVQSLEYRSGQGITVVFGGGLRVTFGDERSYEYKVTVLTRLLESLSAEGKTARSVDLRFGERVTYE
jgi:cell division protein FtsQ